MFNEKIKELKTPVRRTSYIEGLTDYQNEAVIQLKRLRRKSKDWRGVTQAITCIINLKPNNE